MTLLMHVVGARPNFPKLSPVYRAGVEAGVEQIIVHTGQHYDEEMSASFFNSLGIPAPTFNLEIGSGSHAIQTARVMERLEPILLENRPDWLLVYGDVNSTMAASLVASKLGVRVAHVEAGLRSDDRTMPEEINRIVTDRLADLLLTPSRDADERLREEGEPDTEIVFVGNVMIDTLFRKVAELGIAPRKDGTWPTDGSVLVTLHRPSNVDDDVRLRRIMRAIGFVAESRRVIFPAHPRTQARIRSLDIDTGNIEMRGPLPYDELVPLVTRAFCVITDSGGLQEETSALGIPCLTLRQSTERPITVTHGTNQLIMEPEDLSSSLARIRRETVPPMIDGWDGGAGHRVVKALLSKAR
jgi:UDP-N-acetylglucosamine 2-epimerase (non-hydrolysing)